MLDFGVEVSRALSCNSHVEWIEDASVGLEIERAPGHDDTAYF